MPGAFLLSVSNMSCILYLLILGQAAITQSMAAESSIEHRATTIPVPSSFLLWKAKYAMMLFLPFFSP